MCGTINEALKSITTKASCYDIIGKAKITNGLPSVVKQEEETFDGVGGGASGVGVARANGTLRVNETLAPCPRNGGGGVVKEEELLDDLFGSNMGPQAHFPSPYLTLRALSLPPLSAQ